ncbi:type I-E CRISPR-associated protein Cas6/Cse3/CasE [Allokutzneria sp. NRRL B-24872]|uniref:type I-E CRISPR-associated protein Cas6/Cse3/CasE n=1 Tax=Allokutzneria sp. NRRL B-24872 TaxID=1137961 RepID=UPI000A39EFC1|nr:type I-E CRISPR-associated protein Cas6/Cse3/CasE [Allokutzneria sp. NRRL B-24872]
MTTDTHVSTPSLWLSALRLDPRHRDTTRDLGNPRDMHRSIMTLFPDDLGDTPRATAGVLYRIEEDTRGITVLIQSLIQPRPWDNHSNVLSGQTKNLTPFLDHLHTGMTVHYRIAANPQKTCGRNGDPLRGKRVHLWGEDADQWWNTRAEHHGLHLHTATARPHRDGTQPRPKHRNRDHATRNRDNKIQHNAIQFDGLAEITDIDSVRAAITTGIGKGRAHGLGLLSLAPITTV